MEPRNGQQHRDHRHRRRLLLVPHGRRRMGGPLMDLAFILIGIVLATGGILAFIAFCLFIVALGKGMSR